jgi:hypothetical protein
LFKSNIASKNSGTVTRQSNDTILSTTILSSRARTWRARMYLDEPRIVTLFGPFAQRGAISKIVAPAAEEAARTYLHRRFPTVQRF